MVLSRRALVVAAAALPWAAPAQPAMPAEVRSELPGARLSGGGRLTYLLLHVYDARLWVGEGFAAERAESLPVALELEYALALVGRLIAERSLDEMRRVPGIGDEQAARWLAWLTATLPDVAKGDRITGVHKPGESLRLYVNGGLKGELRDAEFARRFIAIWLGPQTSEPALRQQLLGPAKVGS